MSSSQSRWISFFSHMLALVKPLTSIIDLDKDGDIDSDDFKMLFANVLEFLSMAAKLVPEWATMSAGQRIDTVIAKMKEKFPGVPTTVWVILQGLGWFIQKKTA